MMMVKYFMTFTKEGYEQVYNEIKIMDELNTTEDLRYLENMLNLEYFGEEDGEITITNLQILGGII